MGPVKRVKNDPRVTVSVLNAKASILVVNRSNCQLQGMLQNKTQWAQMNTSS